MDEENDNELMRKIKGKDWISAKTLISARLGQVLPANLQELMQLCSICKISLTSKIHNSPVLKKLGQIIKLNQTQDFITILSNGEMVKLFSKKPIFS